MEYYCGPFYLPKFVKKWLSKNFNDSCKAHDIGYNQQNKKRSEYDKEFLNSMLIQASRGKGTNREAYIKYYLVRFPIGIPSWYIIKLRNWMKNGSR